MRSDTVDAALTTNEQFLDMVCADDELLRTEFDAIIAAGWPTPPSDGLDHERAGKPAHRHRRREYRAEVQRPANGTRRLGDRGWTRQRSPPNRTPDNDA